jgi:hypothetical protein
MKELEEAIENFLREEMQRSQAEGGDFNVMCLCHFITNLTEDIAQTILEETK